MSIIDQGAFDKLARKAFFEKFLKLLVDTYVGFRGDFLRFRDATMRS